MTRQNDPTQDNDLAVRMRGELERELLARAGVADRAEDLSADAPVDLDRGVPDFEALLVADVHKMTAEALRIPQDELDLDDNLAQIGVDSIGITEVMGRISRFYGISVAPTTFFEAKTIRALAEILFSRYGDAIKAVYAARSPALPEPPAEPEIVIAEPESDVSDWLHGYGASFAEPQTQPLLRNAGKGLVGGLSDEPIQSSSTDVPIAIISMEGMFPQSADLDQFAEHLRAGDDCMEEVPPSRWDWRAVDGDPKTGAFTDVRFGGFIPDVDGFDAQFFNMSRKEAELLDPQHRLFMECVWKLIEGAGYAPGSLAGSKTGIFVGINLLDYVGMANGARIMEAQQLTGLGHAFCPNRLSFLLDVTGPSQVVDTACSSSLVAIHRAVMAIRHEGCDMAIAGGSNLMLSPTQHIMFSKVGMIATDGRCKTFSEDANGYARADGVGAVLLKRLDRAEADGDPILGVIRASSERHGGLATSLTAPNPDAQAALIVETHRQAGIDPRTIGLVECHGTGTPLGDPVEIEGLKTAFRTLYADHGLAESVAADVGIGSVGIGSVKSNIGHTETAAGVAGVIKVLLGLQDGLRYRTRLSGRLNPLIDLVGSPFEVLTEQSDWARPVIDGVEHPRRAAVSSFGAGGTNAHLVLEEYLPTGSAERGSDAAGTSPCLGVFPVSARSNEALLTRVRKLRHVVMDVAFEDLAYTLQVGRDAMRERVAFVADSPETLCRRMDAFLSGAQSGGIARGTVKRSKDKVRDGGLDPRTVRSADKLAGRWVAGAVVDWMQAYEGDCRKRLRLPTYPFEHVRYWLPLEPQAATSGSVPNGALQGVERFAMTERAPGTFDVALTGDEPFLMDHVIAGAPTLPGVVYLDIFFQVAERLSKGALEIRGVVFFRQLTPQGAVSLEVRVNEGAKGFTAEIVRVLEDGEVVAHAQAQLRRPFAQISDDAGTLSATALGAMRDGADRVLTGEDVYRIFSGLGMAYGPSHRPISEMRIGSDAQGRYVLSRLVSPGADAADGLHPGVMDGAFQTAVGVTLGGDGVAKTALPFAVDRLEVRQGCPSLGWVVVRQSDSGNTPGACSDMRNQGLRSLELTVFDEVGQIWVHMSGFTTRDLAMPEGSTAQNSDSSPAIAFLGSWNAPQGVSGAPVASWDQRTVLLCGSAAERSAVDIGALGADVQVLEGETFEALSVSLIQSLQSLRPASGTRSLVQLLLTEGEDLGGTPLDLGAALTGLLKTGEVELPGLSCQVVSIGASCAAPADVLQKAASAPHHARLRASENGDIEVHGWQAAPEVISTSHIWKTDGLYLITGAGGGLAPILARHVLQRTQTAKVVLCGRSQPSEAVQALTEESGGRVLHQRVDVTDAQVVHGLIDDLGTRFGPLTGVFHAAGLLDDGPLAAKTPEGMRKVLAPKVAGTTVLDAAIGDAPLEFFILFSSLTGALGNPGQADYAAANGFMAAFADQRNSQSAAGKRQGVTLAIDWPLWRDGGMRMDAATERLMQRTTGLVPLETAAGLEALDRCLGWIGAPEMADLNARVLIAVGDAARIASFLEETPTASVPQEAPSPQQISASPQDSPPKGEINIERLRDRVLNRLREEVSALLKVPVEDLDPEVELTEYGFDSISFTQFANRLNDGFDLNLVPTVFFQFPTLDGITTHLSTDFAELLAGPLGIEPTVSPAAQMKSETVSAPPVAARLAPAASPAASSAQAHAGQPRAEQPHAAQLDEPVAIIGMSGQFPEAPDVDAFWRNLVAGRDCITEIPPDRWDWRSIHGDPRTEPGRTNVKWGGFLSGLSGFDAAFFGISPPEARMMDPQQRLLLMEAWRTFEMSGYAPSALSGSKTGVFVGIADTGYGRRVAASGQSVEGFSMTGLAPSLGPNRISFFFNLHGPSEAVETACSSALVALHRAVESIRSGTCEMALAGGVNSLVMPDSYIGFSRAGMLSPDGRSKTFSAEANGYARGEGVGLVLLKRLSEAERDGDRILAVVRATAENHGGRAGSLTAPNPTAQAELLRTAYRRSGIDPRTIGFIETHGTGTPLGDPIEIEALTRAFADLTVEAEAERGTGPRMDCALGAVKSNIGHLEIAAGVAGVIKTIQQMRHRIIAPSLHCETLNPHIKLDGSPFTANRECRTWEPVQDSEGRSLPRRAGVSSFGFGGSNAHVVLEEYIEHVHEREGMSQQDIGPATLVVLSAKSDEALKDQARLLAAAVADGSIDDLAALTFALQVARDALPFRAAFQAQDLASLPSMLTAVAEGAARAGVHRGKASDARELVAALKADDHVLDAVGGMAARGQADALMKLWVTGFPVDWRAHWPSDIAHSLRRRRPVLPTYPFELTEYWVSHAIAVPSSPIVIPEPSPAPTLAQTSEPAPAPQTMSSVERALVEVTRVAAQVLEVDADMLDIDTELGDFGFDSITMTAFASALNEALDLKLTPADFFEASTLARLADAIAPYLRLRPEDVRPVAAPPVAPLYDSPPSGPALASDNDPIAIVGMSCRFPMARDADGFWENLKAGRDCISCVPEDRWNWRDFDGDPKTEPGKTNVHAAGFIENVFGFDPLFFGISPREAEVMDPQQRLALMHAWAAIEDAGHAPGSLAGKAVGVFIGTAPSGYRETIDERAGAEGYIATGAVPSVGPNRISYILDLHGPSEPIETACSSSLVAVHKAIQAIRAGDCDMALAGGVNTILTPEAHINFAKAGMLSEDGRCKTFSKDADGYVRGEGAGMLFLKRLSHAQADGDPILGIVRGTALNHGGRANSLTAPNTSAQAALLVQAYRAAGIDPRTVGYIETHGTGTPLGDPVEINALKSAFGTLYDETEASVSDSVSGGGSCLLGAVKTNIGHLELAAGIAGLSKVLLQMRHREIAPTLHGGEPNPYIDIDGSPFRIVRAGEPWKPVIDTARGEALPLRAGVSSFGFGGVNAHVVLEEAPKRASATGPAGPQVLVFSAQDESGLNAVAARMADALKAQDLRDAHLTDGDLGDLAYTLQIGRDGHRARFALVAGTLVELADGLRRFIAGDRDGIVVGTHAPISRGKSKAGDWISPDAPLEDIARHWVDGGRVDWRALHRVLRRRLRLPTYPFREDVIRARRSVDAPRAPNTGVELDPSRIVLEPHAFYLTDHVVGGAKVLPGAMALEIVRAAYVARYGAGPLSLKQIVWERPVTVAEDPLEARVEWEDAKHRFKLVSTDGLVHVRGIAELCKTAEDGDAIQVVAGDQISADAVYRAFQELGLAYGPAFHVIEALVSGETTASAHLNLLPSAVTSDVGLGDVGPGGFVIHPSMLDGAFQACLGVGWNDGNRAPALPFAVDSIDILAPTTEQGQVRVRLVRRAGGISKFDIDLLDAAERVSVRIRGFAVKTLNSAPEKPEIVHNKRKLSDVAELDYFSALIAAEAGVPVERIGLEDPFEDFGIDSIMITRLTVLLEADFGTLPKTLFFEHQTLGELIAYFRTEHAATLRRVVDDGATPGQPPHAPVSRSNVLLQSQTASVKSSSAPLSPSETRRSSALEPIAVIGLAGRYPKAHDIDAFWRNLMDGVDCISEVPSDRWDHAVFYDPQPGTPGKTNSRWGGFMEGVDRFDPLFFNIAPKEAAFIDPQERLFLQCAWETLENAGYTRRTLAAQGPVGVFIGVMYEEYQLYGAEAAAAGKPVALSGSAASIANRVSYFCDFKGPSMAVDSMCSSSLTATHLACDAIRAGSCTTAIAGGVNLSLHPNKYLALSQGKFMSSAGKCEAFGTGGDGYVPGEGVGAVLLKPLAQAEADGDRIWGVIRSSSLNHGGKTNGYTVPNPKAQGTVIANALEKAGVSPREISYLEAHGTGTKLGDPIEIAALTSAYRTQTDDTGFCAIGSVKSNIGHCESAAGIAGLTKVLLQMHHRCLAPSLHAKSLNPGIDFEATPFRVQQEPADWPCPEIDGDVRPRIAGLSSFGAGGSNAHLVIEAYEPRLDRSPITRSDVFPVSARDKDGLRRVLRRLRDRLMQVNGGDLDRVARTLQEGREALEERVAIVASDLAGLCAKLDDVLGSLSGGALKNAQGIFTGHAALRGGAVLHNGSPDELAAHWAAGGAVDWRQRRVGAAGRTVSPSPIDLPSYPFAEDRYWAPDTLKTDRTAIPTSPDRAENLAAQRRPSQPLPLMLEPEWRAAQVGEATPRRVLVLTVGLPSSETHALEDALPTSHRLETLDTAAMGDEGASGDRHLEAATYAAAAVRLLERLRPLMGRVVDVDLVQLVLPETGDTEVGFAGLAGMIRTAGWEKPKIRFQTVHVDQQVIADGQLATRLLGCGSVDAIDVRLTTGGVLSRHWAELSETPSQRVVWSAGGAYLITGGAGGLGRALCYEIAGHAPDSTIHLIGRSELGDDGLADLQSALQSTGAAIQYHRVDICDGSAVRNLVDGLYAAHGRLDGVIHAAGLKRDGLMAGKTVDQLREVLAPKVAGTLNLDAAIGSRPLGFMALYASASGALGNAGQADYATANSYLDAFATWRAQAVERGARRGRTVSFDWPLWRDGGMAADDRVVAAAEAAIGISPLETEAAFAAQRTILGGAAPQVLVMDGDHDRLRDFLKITSTDLHAPAPQSPSSSKDGPAIEQVISYLAVAVGEVLQLEADQIDPSASLDRYGLESVSALEVAQRLESDLGDLPATLLIEYPRLEDLATALMESHGGELLRLLGESEKGAQNVSIPAVSIPAASSPATSNPVEVKRPKAIPLTSDGIAIVAMSGRFPGGESMEAFWEVLRDGRDCVTEIPADRWQIDGFFSPTKGEPGSSHCRWGGFLKDVDKFDAAFFGYSPRDAALADPQERLFLETVWDVLERAGYTRARLRKVHQARIGVFVGTMYQQYRGLHADDDGRAIRSTATQASIANRTSYFFDFEGPSVAVDSMCASGLQALHMACQSLRLGECRAAVAGGVNLSIDPDKYRALSRSGLVASTADSRSFTDGDGYIPAEGVGAVLLKSLADAQRDGDQVLAVVRASAANHAGHGAGFGLPNADVQARLFDDAFDAASIDPRSIGYLEAAANGSPLGDAIEVRAASRVFKSAEVAPGACAIGSVKNNIGHAEAASGMAQLAKVLLQLEHRVLVPGAPKTDLNPKLTFEGTPFHPQTDLQPWHGVEVDGTVAPLRSTISAFGAGGSNVILVLEEAPASNAMLGESEQVGSWRFPVFARTAQQLTSRLRDLARTLTQNEALSLAALSDTLCRRREVLAYGVDLRAADRAELIAAIATAEPQPWLEHTAPDGTALLTEGEPSWPPVALVGYPFARDRHWLEERTSGDPDRRGPREPGPSSSEDPLAVILSALAEDLGVALEDLEAGRSFVEQGADSMFAHRLIHRLDQTFGVSLAHSDMRSYPTPAGLAQRVESMLGDGKVGDGKVGDGTVGDAVPGFSHAAADLKPAKTVFALTEGQRALWMQWRMHPGDTGFIIPMVFDIGADNPGIDMLRAACRWLLEQAPILAGRIVETDTAHRPNLHVGIETAEMSETRLQADDDIVEAASACALEPFDLSAGPLVRFAYLAGDDGKALLVIAVHHIIFDGVSAANLMPSFWRAVDDLKAGREPEAVPEAADFTDFAAWETGFLASARGAKQLAYWQDRLAEVEPMAVPQLSADPNAPGGSVEMELGADRMAAVRSAAAAANTTPAAVFAAGIFALLHRITGDTDVVIGMPVIRRPDARFARSIGYFANVVLLRQDMTGPITIGALLEQVADRFTEALDNAEYPFASLIRDVPGWQHDRPAFEVAFSYSSASWGTNLGGAGAPSPQDPRHLDHIRQPADVPLVFEVTDTGDGGRLSVLFRGGKIDADAAGRVAEQFLAVLDAGLHAVLDADPRRNGIAVGAISLVSDQTRRKLLDRWGRGPALPRRRGLVAERFAERARLTPNGPAILSTGRPMSYKKLAADVEKNVAGLRRLGVERGDRVAVMARPSAAAITLLLACLRAGCVWVPIDPQAPVSRLRDILQDAAPKLLVTESEGSRDVAGPADVAVPVIAFDELTGKPQKTHVRSKLPKLRRSDPAYMIYTSGSTGRPKGVVVSHGALADHFTASIETIGWCAEDTVLVFSSLAFDASLDQILPVLICGGRIAVAGEAMPSAAQLRDQIVRDRPTVLDLPPAYLREVTRVWQAETDAPKSAFDHIRALIVGGEAILGDDVRLWAAGPLASARLINCYGPTETTITSLIHEITPDDAEFISVPIGRPLPGTVLRILDAYGQPVPEGVVGDILIGGSRVADGYHDRAELTAERFIEREEGRFYRTGDRGFFIPGRDGVVGFAGRIDRQVKLRGHRIELGEVEAAIRAVGFSDCAVVVSDGALVAYLEDGGQGVSQRTIQAELATRLSPNMIPSRIVLLPALPRTPGGKPDLGALGALGDPGDPLGPGVAKLSSTAMTETEQRLGEIWRAVLELGSGTVLEPDSDFYGYGGHSLLLLRLHDEVARHFDTELGVGALSVAPTLATQAELIRKSGTDGTVRHAGLVKLAGIEGEAGAPLVLMHAIAGTVGCYAGLSRRLSQKRLILGLPSPALDSEALDSETVDANSVSAKSMHALSRDYADWIRRAVPGGAVHLVGWSMGGFLAHAVAARLIEDGRAVGLVGLIDSFTPVALKKAGELGAGNGDGTGAPEGVVRAFVRDVLGEVELPASPESGEPTIETVTEAVTDGRIQSAMQASDIRRVFDVYQAHAACFADHRVSAIDLPGVLIRAGQERAAGLQQDWDALFTAGLEAYEVDAGHYDILEAPHDARCAAILDDALARAEARLRSSAGRPL